MRRTPIDLAIFNAGLGGSLADDAVAETPGNRARDRGGEFRRPGGGRQSRSPAPWPGAVAARSCWSARSPNPIRCPWRRPMPPPKPGLRMFAEALGLRMAKHGVMVTLVSPGFIDTPMSRKVTEPKPFLMNADDAARSHRRAASPAATRVIVVPWQFRVIRAFTESSAPRVGALGPVARMTARPILAPESGLLARLTGQPRRPRRPAAAALGHSARCCWSIIGHRLTELGWREIWTARARPIRFLSSAGPAILPPAVRRLSGLSQSLGRGEHAAYGGDPAQAAAQHLHAGLFRRGVFLFLGASGG